MASHDGKAEVVPDCSVKIDRHLLSCPRCGSKLRLAWVSADIVSSPEAPRIVPKAPAETIGAVIQNGGDTLLLEVIERRAILTAMREAGNDKILAARMLGIGKTTLYRKLKEYGFDARSRLVSADAASSPEASRIVPKAPAEMMGTVIEPTNHPDPLEAIEQRAILTAMRETKNDRQLVAQMLGIGRTTLYRRLKEYGIPLACCPRSKATRKI